jgi:UDP-glucose-4-epimerase GalE
MKAYNLSGGSAIVVGGAGYIGSHVCKALAAQGVTPIVFDNFSCGHKHAVKWGDYVEVDVRDRNAIFKACEAHKQVKTIIHLASSIEVGEGEKNPAFFYENNVLGALNLLDAMHAAGQDRLIFSSTCATYGELDVMPLVETMVQNPFSVYGKTKLAIEHMIQSYHKSYGLNYVTLRYFNASGADPEGDIGEEHDPETHLIPNALKAAAGLGKGLTLFGTDYDTPDGTCVRDYIHVNDIAAAHLDAMTAFDKGLTQTEVNIGTGVGISVLEIIKMIETVTGLAVPYTKGPRRDGDLTQLYADASRAKAVLGFEPQYSNLGKIIETAWRFHRKAWTIS